MISASYKNKEFLHSHHARTLRILAEYLHPDREFGINQIQNTIIFFGSARMKHPRKVNQSNKTLVEEMQLKNYRDACKLSYLLAKWSKTIQNQEKKFYICSGGGGGIMEASNRGAYLAKEPNIGLQISLPSEQQINKYITENISFQFHYFFTRKYWFAYLAKCCLFFPGGFGTLDELFEILTLVQTQKIKKKIPLIMFNKKFWDELVCFDTLKKYELIGKEDMNLLYFTNSVQDAFDYIIENIQQYH